MYLSVSDRHKEYTNLRILAANEETLMATKSCDALHHIHVYRFMQQVSKGIIICNIQFTISKRYRFVSPQSGRYRLFYSFFVVFFHVQLPYDDFTGRRAYSGYSRVSSCPCRTLELLAKRSFRQRIITAFTA